MIDSRTAYEKFIEENPSTPADLAFTAGIEYACDILQETMSKFTIAIKAEHELSTKYLELVKASNELCKRYFELIEITTDEKTIRKMLTESMKKTE